MSTDVLNQRFLHVPRYSIVVSLVIHISIPFAILMVKGLESLGLNILPEVKRPPIKEVYQTYIQVDSVALPDQLINEKFNMDPTLPIVDNAAKAAEEQKIAEDAMREALQAEEAKRLENEMATKTAEEKRKEEEKKKLEAKKKTEEDKKKKAELEKALKKLQKEAEREAALKGLAKDGKAGRQKLAGNKLSKGTSATGILGTAKEAYGALVKQKIQEHFHILPGQNRKGLVAIVHIELTPQGRLRDRRVVKTSRDPIFDASVLQAILESQPLPAPDDPAIISDGITLEFRPEGK